MNEAFVQREKAGLKRALAIILVLIVGLFITALFKEAFLTNPEQRRIEAERSQCLRDAVTQTYTDAARALCYQNYPDTRQRSASVPAAVMTAVTKQSREGITEADLDQAGLARLEGWIVDIVVEKTALTHKSAGLDYDPDAYRRSLRPTSVYTQVAGVKFAITKLRPPGVRMVSIIGIRGDQVIRVMCIRESEEDILVLSGECGRAIEQAFNVLLPAQ